MTTPHVSTKYIKKAGPCDGKSFTPDQAMALLRKTVDMGYRSAANFRTDTALDPLRNRDDFKTQVTATARGSSPIIATVISRLEPPEGT